ncbi:MAG: metalloregulator ArsR/SmtB family transcription factor [Pseudomonadales bacterium]|nr:metalloregulator ArsR/SmtB family transcription factor [Pseudomonadales bacterium]
MTNTLTASATDNVTDAVAMPMSESFLARACKAAADPLRLKILRVLRAESFGVLELCHILDLAQPKLSHHLKVLSNAGLVATRREGNSIFYRRPLLATQSPLALFNQALFRSIDQLPLEMKVVEHLNQIREERARSSLEFFAKNATKFKEHQALVAENTQYAANIRELIKLTLLPPNATAIEIGPGEGDFLAELATQFDQVIAIDNSTSMLEIAQQKAAQAGHPNIKFIHGEPLDAVTRNIKGDLLVCNMVLHHIASPAATFQHGYQLLLDGGYMLLAELCPHDQSWVKDSCGDIWLGFEPEELRHWAEAASLELRQSLFLGLRNGFQVQLHLFQKRLNPTPINH